MAAALAHSCSRQLGSGTRRCLLSGAAASRHLSSASVATALEASLGTATQRRSCSSASTPDIGGTQLGRYLESCGANWCEPPQVQRVAASEDGTTVTWPVDVNGLSGFRPGDLLESPPFTLPGGQRARFHFFPKGDSASSDGSHCSLWLCTDAPADLAKLRIGSVERDQGCSQFCRLEDALQGAGESLVVSLEVPRPEEEARPPTLPSTEQSLKLQGLEVADWQIFNAGDMLSAGELVSSPPFRFHHVLLGDMYLELMPRQDMPGVCAVFFRCRVPRMRLEVKLEDGSGAFCKTFESVGKSTPEEDLKAGRYLNINVAAPHVLQPDGSLTVRASLGSVKAIPAKLSELIPRLDERASWPKRL